MDGREWLAAHEERLQDVRTRAARAERELAEVAGRAASRDGAVVVTVGPSGALQDLVLTEHADALPRRELAAAVLATAERAHRDAVRQTEAALGGLFGPHSAAMAQLRSYLGRSS